MENTYCVYKHTTPGGKIYIGQTKQNPSKRFANGNGYKKCPAFYNAIKKYGWAAIKHEILFDGLTAEEANEKEKELIRKYKSDQKEYGYNVTSGGQFLFTLNAEALQRKSQASKHMWESDAYRERKKESMLGSRNPMYGKKMSEESRKKMSQAAKGRKRGPMSADAKKKLSAIRKAQGNFRLGTHHTEESKRKISKANKGKKVFVSEETKNKISNSLLGVPKSEKARENMKAAQQANRYNRAKKVIQLSLKTKEVIKEYDSLIDAAIAVGASGSSRIIGCCKGKFETAYGYYWQYAN